MSIKRDKQENSLPGSTAKNSPAFDKYAPYRIEYAKKNYKRVPLDVSKELYQEIKNAADSVGESVNGYIKEAIKRRIDSKE